MFNQYLSRGNLDKSLQFLFTFAHGKVSAVQRLTIGPSGQEYYGPMLKSKKSAIEYARIGRELANKGRGDQAASKRLLDKRFKQLGKMLSR